MLALAFTVGSEAGGAAFAGLGHYIVLISSVGLLWMLLAAYPMGIVAGRKSPAAFSKAMLSPQAVAVSTRSSLASLPAMLTAARALNVREPVVDVSLPLAVALFRSTGPAMNTAVAFYVAHWLGLHPSPAQMIAATAVGAVMSYGAISLPGEITFISSIAPISLALGVPIGPLALLVAVEMIPDIFRTLGNVTFDVALTTVVDRETQEARGRLTTVCRLADSRTDFVGAPSRAVSLSSIARHGHVGRFICGPATREPVPSDLSASRQKGDAQC